MTILEAVKELSEKFRGRYCSFKVEFMLNRHDGSVVDYSVYVSVPGISSISVSGCSTIEGMMAEVNAKAEQFLRAPDVAEVAADADKAVEELQF